MIKVCLLHECNEKVIRKNSSAKYCCDKHRQRDFSRRYNSSRVETKKCLLSSCGKFFTIQDRRKKYCSRSCAATANNILKSAKNARYCFCGERLEWWQKVGCSREHGAQNKTIQYINLWLDNQVNGSDSNGNLKDMCIKYLKDQAGWLCASPTCAYPGGWSVPNPITGKPILTIDHIDGNWKNNAVDNLIVLCYSCHTLTPTFGSLNMGNVSGSRPYRDMRKRSGQIQQPKYLTNVSVE